jgi:hypothetical protein
MADDTPPRDARCKYCLERFSATKFGAKAVAESSHPGAPNSCIALALLRLRRTVRARLPKPKG